MQISFAVTAKLISAFVFATRIVQSLYFLNMKFEHLAFLCDSTAWFVSDLVGNPEDRFSHNEAQVDVIMFAKKFEKKQLISNMNARHMSRVIRKPDFCKCENKGAD